MTCDEWRFALVVGEAGSGKTSISNELVHLGTNVDNNPDWGKAGSATQSGNVVYESQFEFVFMYQFREASGRDAETTLEDFLFSSAGLANLEKSSEQKTAFFNHLIQSAAKCLLVLDGLDEFKFFKRLLQANTNKNIRDKMPLSELLKNLVLGNLLPNCLVVVTSRPARVNQLTMKFKKLAKVFLVQPLNDEQKCEVCRKLLPQSSSNIIVSAQQVDVVWNFMTTPFISQMVCSVFARSESFTLSESCGVTDLYEKFLLLYMNSGHVIIEQDLTWRQRKILVFKLAECAGLCLLQKTWSFSEKSLFSPIPNERQESAFIGEILPCVLRMGYNSKDEPEYYFVHYTFQEFFAAMWLWISEPKFDNRVKEVLGDPSSNLLLFYCGLGSERAKEFWETFFGVEFLPAPRGRIYRYAVSILEKNWKMDNLYGCWKLMQAACDSGDSKLLSRLADSLPDSLVIDTRKKGGRVYAPLGQVLQHRKDTVEAVQIHLQELHIGLLGPLLRSGAEKIDLGGNNLTPRLVSTLRGHFDVGPRLDVRLVLQHNPGIGDASAPDLAKMCFYLTALDLWNCGLTADGIKTFAAAITSQVGLTELNLGMNVIGDEGLISLINCSGLMAGLQRLALKNCGIGDRGARCLADRIARTKNQLKAVDLRQNDYETEVYEALLQLVTRNSRFVHLVTLKLGSTKILSACHEEVLCRNGLLFSNWNKSWCGECISAQGNVRDFVLRISR